ncbi:Sugar transporter 1 [Hibiscus syriacus]|uniref:Sugar transporter 1 n=1 Tax=Hibiscus syriacus TaxID=106335 RepID=A0A6A3CY99_HIBSY|nr:Sugar transporter 1 [Hibiscus syriacus]
MASSSSGKHRIYRGIRCRSSEAVVNFPAAVASYPTPASTTSADIRAAAAASLQKPENKTSESEINQVGTVQQHEVKGVEITDEEYVDEVVLLNLPNLLVDMAEGLLVSPPRISSAPSDDDSPRNSHGESLWNY